MTDPYEEVWKTIIETFNSQTKMITWIAERTMSVKDYKEFINEFAKKLNDHDELIGDNLKEGR